MEMLMSEVICLYYPLAGLVDTVGVYGIPVERGQEIETIVNLTNKRKTEIRKLGKEYALSCSWENRAKKWTKLLKITNLSFEYKIKIINLKRRIDRKNYIIKQLSENNITNYDIFEAIDGKKINCNINLQLLFEGNDFNYKKGVIGCALSHIHLWNELINDNNSKYYVILEDDIDLCNNFKQYLDYVCNLFDEQNLEHLALGEYSSKKDYPSVSSSITVYKKNLYEEGHITFAYIISKSAAIKAYEFINNCSIKCAIDNPQAFGYILNYSAINYKLVNCKIINDFGTDIQNDNNFEIVKNNTNNILTISFCDWWESEYCGGNFDVNNNFFTNLLTKYGNNYHVKIIEPNQNPDILFFSIFGDNHKYFNAKRKVFFSGEPVGQNSVADFNITFDPNTLNNLRLPLWICYFDNNILEETKRRIQNIYNVPTKEQFCSFIASGPGLTNNRKDFVDKLSNYKKVDCGGAYLNNIGGSVPIGINCSGKVEHNKKYKFAMAFESKNYPGYVTEKICDIFKSNTIPIYWGTSEVIQDFNPKSFINANDFSNFDELVEFIKKVDNDDILYASYFKEPILSNMWIDIFTDKNSVFFKNLVDKIIGSNVNLLNK
jgi:GR25 family glycosyltransferase involved in LPS biosynthesis